MNNHFIPLLKRLFFPIIDGMSDIQDEIFEECKELVKKCRQEASRRIIGQESLIDSIMMAMIAGGHILLEGVPGLAKTLAVKTFADIAGMEFKRIQFTPDLLPADLTGTLLYDQANSRFTMRRGPVFANIVLADEINRSPAKVQSALLEAMAEHQVTIGDRSWQLPEPFFVLATQNPIEQEGTYSLPEAELDRFLLKVNVPYPTAKEEFSIIKTDGMASSVPVEQVFSPENLKKMQDAAKKVACDDKIIEYIVSIVASTRISQEKKNQKIQGTKTREDIFKYIAFGASPRASIALYQCSRIKALFEGRSFVLPEDVKSIAGSVLRHRLVLSYEASADGLTQDDLISKILTLIPVP